MPTHRHTDAYTHAHTHACACTHLFMNACMPVLINSTNIKTKLKAQLEAHCQIYYWLYCELWTAPLILIANFDNWLQRYKEPQVKWNLKRNCFHIYKYMIVVQWFLKSTDTYFPISPSFLSSCLPSPPLMFSIPRLALNSLCSWGWLWTPDTPASTSQALEFLACTTTPSSASFIIKFLIQPTVSFMDLTVGKSSPDMLRWYKLPSYCSDSLK